MLRPHRRRDLAAAMIGIRQQNIINKGTIERNDNEIIASTIDMTSFARGSKRCITES
jgi:hypothetical protein